MCMVTCGCAEKLGVGEWGGKGVATCIKYDVLGMKASMHIKVMTCVEEHLGQDSKQEEPVLC